MPVGDLRHRLQVRNIGIGITEALHIQSLRIVTDSPFKILRIRRIDKIRMNSVLRKRMGQQIIRSAVYVVCRHDMLPAPGQVLDRIGHGSRSRGHSQSRCSSLQSRDTALKYVLGRIGQPSIYISRILQTEPRRGVIAVMKHIR